MGNSADPDNMTTMVVIIIILIIVGVGGYILTQKLAQVVEILFQVLQVW